MVTTKTDPAWVRNPDITFYGGNVNKKNYLDQGSIDPETDIDASEYSGLVDHMAAAVRTSPFAIMTIDVSTPTSPTFDFYNGQPGSGDSVKPTLSGSAGSLTITYATSYNDSYGQAGTTNIQAAHVTPIGGADTGIYATLTSTYVVTVTYTTATKLTIVLY